MDDSGEKIVFLAREILNAGIPESAAKKKQTHITTSFKTLCFTTFLAASGGGLVTGYLHNDTRPLNRYERTEIQALLFYTSKLKGVEQETLRHEIEKQIGIADINDLTANEFPAAQRYLQERAQ
jgi:hypothetical protein